MAEFDFTTLNYSDLEDLVCDLWNAEQRAGSGIRYKTFKDGKDQGIDILYSSDNNKHDHVGQVKHYLNSGYDLMYKVLKETETEKVKKLSPNRYLFATSLDLSVAQTESIQKLFTPFIRNLTDIYGKKDLNNLLEKHPDVVRNQFKLWLASIQVLQSILNSDLIFRSSDHLSELKRRIRIYVQTPAFEIAKESLEKNKFIVITGEPGVGKSTLADMLAFYYTHNGYAFTYLLDDIKEAERTLNNDSSKQIIYYDDFLGSNEVEINKARGSETALIKIIKRISNSENKLLILTTRSYLLNAAVEKSERLESFSIKKKESILSLEEYSYELRLKLYNIHIEESELNDSLKSLLRTHEIRDFVVSHPNFFPRSVEYITNKELVNEFSVESFKKFIYTNFDNPNKIYAHAYDKQIESDDRLLLNTLMSFDKPPSIDNLEIAFINRVNHEIKTNNKIKNFNAFKTSLKRLDGGFISINNSKREVDFINPSLIDFLNEHIKGDNDEISRIMESICLTPQLVKVFLSENTKSVMPGSLKARLLNNYDEFIRQDNYDLDSLKVALVIFKKINLKESEKTICKILEQINDWEGLHNDYSLNSYFRNFMTASIPYSRVHKVLTDKILTIANDLLLGQSDLQDIVNSLEQLTKDYDLELSQIPLNQVQEHIETLLTDYIDEEIDTLKDYISDKSEASDKRSEIEDLVERFNSLGLTIDPDLENFDIDWHEVAMDNYVRRAMEKGD